MERKEEDASPTWKWTPESYDEISEYIRQVDEILDFIKPFPRDRCPERGIPLQRSASAEGTNHLENLVKLVEQLKQLKEKESKMNERTQYLKDLKKLRERKKLLKYEAEMGAPSSPPAYWTDASKEEKPKSSMPFRKTNRGRSKSVSTDELVKDGRFRRGRFSSDEEQRRKMSAGSQKTEKSKVSKWSKVKEAFRWERASVDGKPCPRREEVHYLQVPQDKTPESLSDSPLSGQISGSSSVGAPSTICLAVSSGYSGEHSSEGHSTSSGYGIDLPPPPPPPLPAEDDFLSLPLIQDLSSSSSSEKLDELLTYSEILAKGNDRNDLIADSFDSAFHDVHQSDELESRRSKSLDGDTVLGPSTTLMQHLSKDSLNYSKKTHKTAWGKVKDIIQTRKDSLKKKPKKRNSEKGGENFGLEFEGQEDPSSPEDKPKEVILSSKHRIEVTEPPDEVQTPPSPNKSATDSVAKRRLTPVLTITLPSTEELRSISPAEADNSNKEDKGRTVAENADYFEDIPKYEKSKTGSYHRFSKWTKVKRAFLTNPSRTSDFMPEASSAPSSPNKQISFFSDVESDELSSGDWTDYKVHSQEKPVTEVESPGAICQEDIQKHYQELNQKLSHEFDQKMREWERMKSSKAEGTLQKQKSEDWDKIPRTTGRQRESMTIPLPKLDDLSPEFKKKLDEWKKIKKSQTISAVPGTSPKDEAQNQHFKMRIGEWQKWRPRGNQKTGKTDHSDEFAKKLEEWQRIKGTVRRSRSQSGGGKDEGRNRSPSPGLRRKSSKKKTTSSGKSSGTESLSGSLKEKDGRGSRKQQKEKDLQWLEKELHKIERGKMRLEREKEKFLEREARLEKMKRTMGTTSPTQEILIKTPTGFFRFEGISQKFTKKLYEWEKARGIAPEASTFALLEECVNQKEDRSNGMSLQRSKSMGSVMEVSSAVQDLPHHPSSLSLNDVDELDVAEIGESRASSEPALPQDEDEPEALIVDVEDVVEETAALMTDVLVMKGEVPVYSYAPVEITQLIDSSPSESDAEVKVVEQKEGGTPLEVMSATCRHTGNESEDEDGGNGDEEDEEEEEEEKKQPQQISPEFPETLNQQQVVNRVQELSSQLLCLAEKLEMAFGDRTDERKGERKTLYHRRKAAKLHEGRLTADVNDTKVSMQELSQLPSLITNKVLELKCGLNVLTESPIQDGNKFNYGKTYEQCSSSPVGPPLSNQGEDQFRILEKSKAQILFGEEASREYDRNREVKSNPEAIKHKIREKISLMQKMTTEARPRNFKTFELDGCDSEVKEDGSENVVVVRKNSKENKQKKLLKTRRITDTTIAYKQMTENKSASEREDLMPEQRFPVHINTEEKTPANVFVPTTRKIISPVRRDSQRTTSVLSYVIDDIATEKKEEKKEAGDTAKKTSEQASEKTVNRDIGIPPLPNSPITTRKPTSPNIRMMVAKYNQKIEQTAGSDTGGSTPAWRSPVMDRKSQNPKVEKSASLGLIKTEDKAGTTQEESVKGILKSSSAGLMDTPPETEMTASALRALRIKKAKEEFLSRGPGGDGWASAASTPTTESPTKRLSHVSMGSESSYEGFDVNLVKSASAGAINMEDESRRSSERSDDGTKPAARAASKFGISSIKSRFRKVRMKRGKEKEGALSTLCRQSLLLEIPVAPTAASTSKSCPSSPVLERSKSKTDNWIRNPFKTREPKP